MGRLAAAVAAALLPLWVLLGAASPLAAQQPAPAAVIQAHFAAWNAMDAAGVMATLAEGAVLEDHGTVYASMDEIEEWVVTRMPANPGVLAFGFQSDGTRVSYAWQRMGDAFHQRLGVPQFAGRGEAVVEDGQITHLHIIPHLAAMTRLRADLSVAQNAAIAARNATVAPVDAGTSGAADGGASQAAAPLAVTLTIVGVVVLAMLKRPQAAS